MNEYDKYLNDLSTKFWSYFDKKKWPISVLDKKYGCDRNKRPVFLKKHQEMNLIVDPHIKTQAMISLNKRDTMADDIQANTITLHRWFRSMNSSQALAISVFKNLLQQDCIKALSEVIDDSGNKLFDGLDFNSDVKLELEKNVDWLEEKRPTSLDACLCSDNYRIAIECKLTEQDIGACSRPKEKIDSKEYCNGTYGKPKIIDPNARCVLSALNIAYWEYIPTLFNWNADQDHEKCPLRNNYQLVRNILSASVRDKAASRGNGHAVLLYDERNPNFGKNAEQCVACKNVKHALIEKSLLRTCSWQSFLRQLSGLKAMAFTLEEISMKYGLC